jgi:hypothetical protein
MSAALAPPRWIRPIGFLNSFSFIEFDGMSSQQLAKFLLKGQFLVMGFLTIDVRDDIRQFGFAYRKRAIAFLPGEASILRVVFIVNPFRRIGLDHANNLGHRNGRRQPQEQVDMIGYAAGANQMPIQPGSNRCHVAIQILPQIRLYERAALFRAVHDVNQ